MKRHFLTLVSLFILLPASASAGTIFDMVTKDMQGQTVATMTFYFDGVVSRMDLDGPEPGSVIFRGDDYVYLDHAQKQYIVMDSATLDSISSQINEALQELEAQLAAMPAEQRAMFEEMMKEQMDMLSGADGPSYTIEPAGSGRWQSQDCQKAVMYEDGSKIGEICSVAYDSIDASGDLEESSRAMAQFLSRLYDAIPMPSGAIQNPMQLFEELDGFPVHSIEFEYGEAVSETSLGSVRSESIDGALFEIPGDYAEITIPMD